MYGDGVNVAARLQAEAKPGSIYLSRTVYDVVKGKMRLPAIYIGPRHLKGITEPVAVWEVPALGRQELDKRQDALMAMNPMNLRMDLRGSGVPEPFCLSSSALCYWPPQAPCSSTAWFTEKPIPPFHPGMEP